MPSHCQVVWRNLYGRKLPLVIADEAPDNDEGEETAEEVDEGGDNVTAENGDGETSGQAKAKRKEKVVKNEPRVYRARFEEWGKVLGEFSDPHEKAQAEEKLRQEGKRDSDEVMKVVRRNLRKEEIAKKRTEKEQAQPSSQRASSVSAPSLDDPDKPEAEPSCQFLTRAELKQAMLDGARELSNLVDGLMDDFKSRIAHLL